MTGTAINARTVECDDRTLTMIADAGGQAWIVTRDSAFVAAELAYADGRYILRAQWDIESHSTVEVRVRGRAA